MAFVRPIIEYGSIIYDSCNLTDSNKIEQIQLEAARIVTGAKKGTSHSAMYHELSWLTLQERRTISKLVKMYNIVKKESPGYLYQTVQSFQTSQQTTRFSVHGGLKIPQCRTEVYRRSPIVSCIQLWNQLDASAREVSTLAIFKNQLNGRYSKQPALFHHTKQRALQVAFTQIRMGFSNLNSDLASRNLVPIAKCSCGDPNENAKHFFLSCPLYSTIRNQLMSDLTAFADFPLVTVDILLYGSPVLSAYENTQIFSSVYKYINDSKRF